MPLCLTPTLNSFCAIVAECIDRPERKNATRIQFTACKIQTVTKLTGDLTVKQKTTIWQLKSFNAGKAALDSFGYFFEKFCFNILHKEKF